MGFSTNGSIIHWDYHTQRFSLSSTTGASASPLGALHHSLWFPIHWGSLSSPGAPIRGSVIGNPFHNLGTIHHPLGLHWGFFSTKGLLHHHWGLFTIHWGFPSIGALYHPLGHPLGALSLGILSITWVLSIIHWDSTGASSPPMGFSTNGSIIHWDYHTHRFSLSSTTGLPPSFCGFLHGLLLVIGASASSIGASAPFTGVSHPLGLSIIPWGTH